MITFFLLYNFWRFFTRYNISKKQYKIDHQHFSGPRPCQIKNLSTKITPNLYLVLTYLEPVTCNVGLNIGGRVCGFCQKTKLAG